MNCYKAAPVSRKEIRKLVRILKQKTGLEYIYQFPIMKFLEHILPIIFPDFQLEILPAEEMGNKHGETIPGKHVIRIREDVYNRAADGVPRDRMTVAHEIGHLFLHEDSAVALCRLAPGQELKPYEDPEWQADAFGGELLASSYLIRGMSVTEVQTKCAISRRAAEVQLNSLSRKE